MSALKLVYAGWFVGVLSAAVFSFNFLPVVCAADDTPVEYGVQQARDVEQVVLAARLAGEGERQQSPILLLAAAELLSELVQIRGPGEVPIQLGDEEADEQSRIELSAHDLVEKAGELAEGDEQLTALVERQRDQLGERRTIQLGSIRGRCYDCSCPAYAGTGWTCTRGGCGHHWDRHVPGWPLR